MSQQQQDPNAFLMGGGVKGAKFPDQQFGTTVTGTITEPPELRQQRDFDDNSLKFFDDGNPMMQLVVKLQTSERDPADPDDDGVRAVYVKGQLREAVQKAVRAAGADRLEVGGTLTVRYVRDEPNSRGRGKPKKVYTAQYVRSAEAVADGFLSGTGLRPATPEHVEPHSPPADAWASPVAPLATVPPPPPGIDPAQWQRMTPEARQRAQAAIAAALGQAAGGGEPPF